MTKERFQLMKLNNYCSLVQEARELKKVIEELETKCEGTRVIITDMPKGGQPADNFSKLGDSVRKLKRLEEQIGQEIDDIISYILSIEDSMTRQIFTQRYLKGRSWEEVSEITGYSRRQAIRIHNKYIYGTWCH